MTSGYDVAILGAGMGGSMLATILARHGMKVAIFDKTAHPRFAIGESTIPYTTQALAAMSELFDVPELFPRAIRLAVGRTCGVKRHFGYVHHHPGEEADPKNVTMAWLGEPEFHFFRQDVDAHLFHVAVGYGAEPMLGTAVTRVDTSDEGAVVHLEDGRAVQAGFVVDGTGFRSILARQKDLRLDDPNLRTHSRTIFTHMIGVRPFDEVMPIREHQMPGPLYQGTLHHVFDGGWFWIIPFDNHDDSDNPLVSVGLQLDARRFPKRDGVSAEEEFWEVVERFPSISAHFEGARATRPWISTGRLQYASTCAQGQRWALLPHAYGFVDPLYSRGLSFTLDGVKALAVALLDARQDLGAAELSHLDADYRRLLDAHDDLVYGSFVSWRDADLWMLWWYVWVLSTGTEFFLMLARHRWHAHGDTTGLRQLDHYPEASIPEYDAYMKHAVEIMASIERGERTAREGREALLAWTREQPFHYEPMLEYLVRTGACRPPSMLWDMPAIARFGYWVGTSAREDIRDMVMPFVQNMVFRYAHTSI